MPTSDCENLYVDTVVYDQRSRREIGLYSYSGYAHELLDRIRADKAEVKVREFKPHLGGRILHRQPALGQQVKRLTVSAAC